MPKSVRMSIYVIYFEIEPFHGLTLQNANLFSCELVHLKTSPLNNILLFCIFNQNCSSLVNSGKILKRNRMLPLLSFSAVHEKKKRKEKHFPLFADGAKQRR